MDYNKWLGKILVKKSGKSFKDGTKEATPISLGINPYIGTLAFDFGKCYFVNCCQLKLKDEYYNE